MSLITSTSQPYTVDDKGIITSPFMDFNRVVSTRSNYAPYLFYKDVTQYSYVTAGEKDMMSFDIKDSLITDNSQCIEVVNCGDFANNANNKRIRIIIDSTPIYDSGSSAFTGAWLTSTKFIHTGDITNNTTCITTAITSAGLTLTRTLVNVDWTAAQTIKTVGTGVANADVLQDYMEAILTSSR